MLPYLNLPAFSYKIKEVDGKPYIFDIIRRKFVFLSPEEWVRQHFIHLLIDQYGYPRSLFAVETGIFYNALRKRSDIMVLGTDGSPFLLVECKAPGVRIKNHVFDQIARYNFTLKPDFLVVTNGLEHFCFCVTGEGRIDFLADLPYYSKRPNQ